MSRICETCGSEDATLYAFYPAVLCRECVKQRVADQKATDAYRAEGQRLRAAESQPDPRMMFSEPDGATPSNQTDAMNLVKTLESGNQVFRTVEMIESPHTWDNGQKRATAFHVEIDSSGETVRKWEPGFDELAGQSTK